MRTILAVTNFISFPNTIQNSLDWNKGAESQIIII